MLTLLIYWSLDLTIFGCSQNVKYDYTVDLAGTGDRSEYDTENYWEVVVVFYERYRHRGSSEPASVNIIDSTCSTNSVWLTAACTATLNFTLVHLHHLTIYYVLTIFEQQSKSKVHVTKVWNKKNKTLFWILMLLDIHCVRKNVPLLFFQ